MEEKIVQMDQMKTIQYVSSGSVFLTTGSVLITYSVSKCSMSVMAIHMYAMVSLPDHWECADNLQSLKVEHVSNGNTYVRNGKSSAFNLKKKTYVRPI